jgi:AAA15 family ATPase/GTPase
MVVEFSVENFRSFKEKQVFSLLATKDQELAEQNTFEIDKKLRFLRTAVIYGANASGKSNFFKALIFFLKFAITSGPRKQAGDLTGAEPFVFSKQTDSGPSGFEIIFYHHDKNQENVRYRYGFSVDSEKVVTEYLYALYNVREVNLFVREGQDITCTPNFKEGVRAKPAVRSNCTLLSVSAQTNGEIATAIVSYFRNITATFGFEDRSSHINKNINNVSYQEKIIDFLKYADIHIKKIKSEIIPLNLDSFGDPDFANFFKNKYPDAQQQRILYGHTFYDDETPTGEIYLPAEQESTGTQKLFSFSDLILRSLEKGTPLFIDEFDAQLHPLMIESIIKLFNSPVSNPNNAQLVISCHAVNILTNKLFRRDQIWFCEKDQFGATDLYSLVEYEKPVRKDATFSKDYLQGKYGAIPYIDDIYLQTGMR